MATGPLWDWVRAPLELTVRLPGEPQGLQRHYVTVSLFGPVNVSPSLRGIVPITWS